jgi:hypothetical protein
MASIIKADNIQKVSDGTNIIKKCGSTITLGSCGATISLACGATQTGFGQTYSAVEYCTTAKTSPFTAAAGTGYFINTTCGAVTVTLPASPTAGDVVAFKDYASQWNTNSVTLCNNGNKINGVCATASLSTQNQSVSLIYVDATKGWQDIQDSTAGVSGTSYITATGGTVVTCGDYKTHIFTSGGCFSVSTLSNIPANNSVDYLVVAGGGGGGARHGGGGGAGGFRVSNALNLPAPSMSPLVSGTGITVTASTYPITIGGGGTAGTFLNLPSNNPGSTSGSNSVFSTITSTGGGGGGGAYDDHPVPGQGLAGGSGGGSDGNCRGGPGAGNTPPVSPVQGFAGGNNPSPATPYGGAGGGGASEVGYSKPYSPYASGLGGNGSYISNGFINPTCASSYGEAGPVSSTRYFAGGGGGGVYDNLSPLSPAAPGGIGGGGDGVQQNTPTPANANGVTNTGGGGGGEGANTTCQIGGSGGSGIVMIRYKYQ